MKKVRFLIALPCIFVLFSTCNKIEFATKVTTVSVTPSAITIAANGQINDLSSGSHSDYGFCYGTAANPTVKSGKLTLGTAKIGEFAGTIEGLTMGQQYYVRAYCKDGDGYIYGESKSVTTLVIALPTITTTAIFGITTNSATSGGNVTSVGGAAMTERGICYGKTTNPTIASSKIVAPGTSGVFSISITGLTPNTLYYVRAYASTSVGTAYGSEVSFTTNAPAAPTLTTTAASAIAQTTATSGGNVGSDGGVAITERGICYSTTTGPTTMSTRVIATGTTGAFSCNLTGLTPVKTYYVRAYAINSFGTAYGNEISFTTFSLGVPTLTTTATTAITQTTAISGGNVTSDGGAAITERGICFSIAQNPTTSSSKVTATGTTGAFTSSLTGLTPVKTYYVRAYATNNLGTAYGNEVTFITTALAVPSITTTTPTAITTTTAISGGDVTSDGGATITERGICYSTIQNPTTSSSKLVKVGTTGAFTSSITGLTPITTYYVRAYATNSIGTEYGTQVNFTTNATVSDIEGNIYNTVTIGAQIWMKENLKTTKYRDGTSINNVIDNTAWATLTTGGYCWYNNDIVNKTIYGAYYNYYAVVDSRNLCPIGWHIPTSNDWTTLSNYLINNNYGYGGSGNAIGKSLAAITGWSPDPTSGSIGMDQTSNNSSGFTAFPSGLRYGQPNGSFSSVGSTNVMWSSTPHAYETGKAYHLILFYNSGSAIISFGDKNYGQSVRCVKD